MSNPEPTAPEPVADWIIVLSRDGDQWCALIGEDLQVGTAGFGPTIPEAIAALTQEMTVGGAWVGSPLYLGTSLSAERTIRELHGALNDLLALFWRDAQGLNNEKALNALALRPDLPITATFAADVRNRAARVATPDTEP